GSRLVPLLPELHGPHLEAELGGHLPLLADLVPHARLRGNRVLRATDERPRASGAGARGGDVQGVRAAGRQHARGDPAHARVAHPHHQVPPERPGDPAPPPAQDGAALCRRARRRAGRPGERLTEEPTTMPTFPSDFQDLEPFADWAVPTERARYAKRI